MTGHIGSTLAAWRRRRGLSQTVLAGLAGISQAYLSQLEQGVRPLDRRSTQIALAAALNISVAQLTGLPQDLVDPMRERALVHVPAVRTALVELAAGERRTPQLDVDTLNRQADTLTELRNAADYATLLPLLPKLLIELAAHGDDMAGRFVEAQFAARYALRTIGHQDLAREAAALGMRAAQQLGDPAWLGQATYSWVQAFPAENAALGARLVTKAADLLQGLTSTEDRGAQEVYGCLHILAAHQEAIAQRPAAAKAHLDEAATVASALGEPQRSGPMSAGFNGNWFGPAQIQVWRMACAAELGDTSTAMTVAAGMDLTQIPLPNRHVYYWTDLARVLADDGQDEAAMRALAAAETSAPQHFRFSPTVRDLLATIVMRARRRAVTPQMADLARKVGVQAI